MAIKSKYAGSIGDVAPFVKRDSVYAAAVASVKAGGVYSLAGGEIVVIPPEFSTVALGIAGVADGESFMTPQPGGWHMSYQRVGTSASPLIPLAITPEAIAQDADIAARTSDYASLPSETIVLLSASANKWGGRLLQNVNTSVPPTLNAIDAMIDLRDDDGGTTPAFEVSTATDPLGNTEAVRLNYTAYQTFVLLNKTRYPQWTDQYEATLSAYIKQADDSPGGPGLVSIGGSSRAVDVYTPATPSTSWEQRTQTIANYSYANTNSIAVLPPSSGVTYPFAIDLYGVQLGFDTGPLVLSSMAEERASQFAGHAKGWAGYPGAITVDESGMVVASDSCGAVIPLNRQELTEWSIGIVVDFSKADYALSYAAAAIFGNTRDTGTTSLPVEGALGMDTTSRYGRLYASPAYSAVVGRVPTEIINQGPTHLGVTVSGTGTEKTVTYYVNGVPLLETPDTISPISPEVLFLGGSTFARSRSQPIGTTVMAGSDRWGDALFSPSVLSDADMTTAAVGSLSRIAPTQKKALFIGSYDSLTAFSSAPFMNLSGKGLAGAHLMLDAIGGSRYQPAGASMVDAYYNSPVRQGLRRRALLAGAMAYDAVFWLHQAGTNDLVGGVMDPVLHDGWAAGRDIIDVMAASDVESLPIELRSKIKRVLITVPPMGSLIKTGADANDIAREADRVAYNADCVSNFAARGYDYVINWDDYIPSGFASLAAAAKDAADTSTDNGVYQSDGIHWNAGSGTGGDAAADAVLVPFISARVAAL